MEFTDEEMQVIKLIPEIVNDWDIFLRETAVNLNTVFDEEVNEVIDLTKEEHEVIDLTGESEDEEMEELEVASEEEDLPFCNTCYADLTVSDIKWQCTNCGWIVCDTENCWPRYWRRYYHDTPKKSAPYMECCHCAHHDYSF